MTEMRGGTAMKKRIAGVLIFFLCVGISILLGFCQTEMTSEEKMQDDTLPDESAIRKIELQYDLIPVTEWDRDAGPVLSQNESEIYRHMEATEAKGILFCNNGLPIVNDLYVEGKSEGNQLIAVYRSLRNGIPCESYYFTNSPQENVNELVAFVERKQKEAKAAAREQESQSSVAPLASNAAYLAEKEYTWNMKLRGTNISVANLTTTVNFEKSATSTNFNGKQASVWYVTSYSQLEKVNGRLNQYTTKFSYAQTGQTLSQWTPMGDKSSGTITIGFSGYIPTVTYSFPVFNFTVTDETSLSNDYAAWKYKSSSAANLSRISSATGTRAINTSGAFVTRLSHVSKLTYASATDEYKTGELYISFNDR